LTLSQAPSRAKQLLRAGDVLVSMTRPNLNAVALVPEQLDGAIGSTGFHVLRSRWLRPEFLLRLVQSQRFVDEMSALVQGALYPAVRPKDIAAFTFAFETPAQQSRIAAKLEELLSDLDAGVAELKAAQKKLAQYRQSLLKAAVEGVLTAEWRAKNTPSETGAQLLQRILTERRARWEARQLARFAEQGKPHPRAGKTNTPNRCSPIPPVCRNCRRGGCGRRYPKLAGWIVVDLNIALGTRLTFMVVRSRSYRLVIFAMPIRFCLTWGLLIVRQG